MMQGSEPVSTSLLCGSPPQAREASRLAPAFPANKANGVGKYTQKEKFTLQTLRFWQPLPVNIRMNHSWSGGCSPWKRGTLRFLWAAKHNLNPRRKLIEETGLSQALGWLRGAGRYLPYCREVCTFTLFFFFFWYFYSYVIVCLYSNPEESSIDPLTLELKLE